VVGGQRMVEVAVLKGDWLALEAVVHVLALTLQADELHLLLHLAPPAHPRRLPHEAQLMPLLAVDHPQSLLVRGNGVEILPAVEAESHPAGGVLHVDRCGLIAAHAPASPVGAPQDGRELVLELADVFVEADALALEAEVEPAFGTGLGTVLASLAHDAIPLLLLRLRMRFQLSLIDQTHAAFALLLVVD
jgi:hypothetical protein